MNSPAPVTVIVPCYNSSATIGRAVASVLSQTVLPASLMLIDDASTDNTGEILKEFELKHSGLVQRISLTVNRGPSFARNMGWETATTEFVAFLDADDEWHPRKLEILLIWFTQHPEAVFCGHRCIQHSGSSIEINNDQFLVRSFRFRDMLISNRFSTPGVMLRTAVRHRFPISRRYAEDYQLWLMIAADVGHLDRIELPLAWYFKQPYGASGLSANLWAMEKGELAVLSSIRDQGYLSTAGWAALSLFSIAKYAKRCWHAL